MWRTPSIDRNLFVYLKSKLFSSICSLTEKLSKLQYLYSRNHSTSWPAGVRQLNMLCFSFVAADSNELRSIRFPRWKRSADRGFVIENDGQSRFNEKGCKRQIWRRFKFDKILSKFRVPKKAEFVSNYMKCFSQLHEKVSLKSSVTLAFHRLVLIGSPVTKQRTSFLMKNAPSVVRF